MPIDAEAWLLLLVSQAAVAAVGLGVLGVRRWRVGTPGAKLAVLAAGLTLAVPAAVVSVAVLDELGVIRLRDVLGDQDLLLSFALAVSAVPIAVAGWASRAAWRGLEAARSVARPEAP